MIKPGSTIKVTGTTQYHHPQLALQTAAAYFLIREIPSSTIPVFSAQTPFPNDQDPNDNGPGNQGLPKASRRLILLIFALMRIDKSVCTGIHISRTRGSPYNVHHFTKISVGLYISLILIIPLLTSSYSS